MCSRLRYLDTPRATPAAFAGTRADGRDGPAALLRSGGAAAWPLVAAVVWPRLGMKTSNTAAPAHTSGRCKRVLRNGRKTAPAAVLATPPPSFTDGRTGHLARTMGASPSAGLLLPQSGKTTRAPVALTAGASPTASPTIPPRRRAFGADDADPHPASGQIPSVPGGRGHVGIEESRGV